MGIEYIGRQPLIAWNHSVASLAERRVRFLCEKRRHSSQRQPMRPFSQRDVFSELRLQAAQAGLRQAECAAALKLLLSQALCALEFCEVSIKCT